MKEEDIDKRIERVINSVGPKKAAMSQWEKARAMSERRHEIAVKRWRIYGISAVASVAVVCVIGLSLFMNDSVEKDHRISFSASKCEEESIYHGESVNRNGSVYRGVSSDFDEIKAMVDERKYHDALQAIDATLADTIIDPTYPEERKEYLRSVYKNQEYELTWLKINVLIMNDHKSEAIILLKEYVSQEGVHQEEAKTLLRKLEE